MAMDRALFLAVLEDSYSAYYNILPAGETGLPLAFRAEYFSRSEQYFLSKSATIWANETNELCYVFSAPSFTPELADRCMDFVIAESLPRVKPHKEHQYTNFKAVFVADSFDEQTRKAITKRRFEKSYHFSLHGYSALLTAAVDLRREEAFTNPAGRELTDYFRKLFASRKEET